MPHSFSLTRKKDFDNLFQRGKRKASKNFSITYMPANELKFAYIVSKKNVPLATHRNYTRRIIKEIVRTEILPNISNLHIAILCRADLKEVIKANSFEQIKEELVLLTKPLINSNLNQNA